MEAAGIFLVEAGNCDVNITNRLGESPLHWAAFKGLAKLTQSLLVKGSDPNLQTVFKSTDQEEGYYRQTPLHTAIVYRQLEVIDVLLSREASWRQTIDLDVKNSEGN